jgi:pimeloyl-ACP methyl ester carboxylesterase
MEQRFADNSGVRVEYLVLEPSGAAAFPPVLLVPGMGNPARDWAESPALLEALQRSGPRRLLAVSLRGRGQSDTPETGWKPADHHRDMEAVLDAEGVGPCYLIGHSAGGGYALGFTLRRPARVLGLGVGDFPPFFPKYPPQWAAHVESKPDPVGFDRRFPGRLAAEAEWERYETELHRLQMPLLLLRARRSKGTLPEKDLLLYNAAPRLRLVEVDCEHEEVFSDPAGIQACVELIGGGPPAS